MITSESGKLLEIITNSAKTMEVRLSESSTRKIYLRSKEEVDLAFSKGKKVTVEKIQRCGREYTRIFVEVPIAALIDVAL